MSGQGRDSSRKQKQKTRTEHGSGCILWRPNLFTDRQSLDVPHMRSPEPRFTPEVPVPITQREKNKNKNSPMPVRGSGGSF